MFRGILSLFRHNAESFYRKDQQGIISRYLREERNWISHLENTKKQILENIPESRPLNILVLGSGWLLDFPSELLSDKGINTILCDVNHPAQIKNKYKGFENITFMTTDVTNGLLEMADKSESLEIFLNELEVFQNKLEFDSYDFVVSLNILNQLDILLVEFLEERFKVNQKQKSRIRDIVQNQHLNILPQGKTILITDYIERSISPEGEILDKTKLVKPDLEQYHCYDKWDWVFDTNKRYRKGMNTILEVIAISI